ncbi:DDB1- and CUL4-associated factor 17-like [Asterias amurensis]|uniref:DDB1- and CUL4-associated factor 17-like n=1 Tax=Asterias amurensis TaxID=7602 RepID=UPI003AB7285F
MCDPLNSKKLNIALHLRDREAGRGNSFTYRRNCKMWRTLICDKDAQYKKAWTVSSESNIYYLGDRLYLDDFRTCYSLNGRNALPTLIYEENDQSHSYGLEAHLHCSVNIASLPFPTAGHRPYVLALTECYNLICIDLPTGRVFNKVFLGRQGDISFKYLTWDIDYERAVVSTTQSKSSTILKSFVLVNVFPFEVLGRFDVCHEVFGRNIADATITDGLLIVMHKNNKIKMYNMDNIIQENMKFPITQKQSFESTGRSESGQSYHNGIPSNLQLSECPAALLELKCLDRNVSIGGHPWHYMYVPLSDDPVLPPETETDSETFVVCDVATGQMVESGPLEMETWSFNATTCFHFDDSQRIVQLGDCEFIVSTFHTRDDGKSELRVAYRLLPPDAEEDKEDEEDSILITSSGRIVKQNSSFNLRDSLSNKSRISDINYDSELDFLLLSYATQEVMNNPHQSSAMLEGRLGIHCNQTGHLLKMVDLDGLWFEFQPTSIEMDMDFMVQIYTKVPSVQHVCKLYRLERGIENRCHDEK